jgi:hypothetical protein
MTDTLIVNGARCAWWDDISKTANTGPGRQGLPVCPHCRSPLFQHEPEGWWQGVDRHEANGNPGYRKFIEWLRGQCFRNYGDALAAYRKENPEAL